MLIAIGSSSFGQQDNRAMELLLNYGAHVKVNPFGRKLTKEEIIEHLQESEGLLAGLEPLDEEVFSSCPSLKAIARIGIGMDNVDLEAAKRYGIKVSNTPDGPTKAVAEMTLAALLTIARRIIPANDDIHNGIWQKRMGFSLEDSCVFIVGYGRIGQSVAALLRMHGAEVIIYDKYNIQSSTVSLSEGLARADVISLHASGVERIITKETIALCRPGVVLLNSARGSLVDEDVLYTALKEGRVGWYWADALWEEPYVGKLAQLPNAILTPHIATYTAQCRCDMEMAAVKNLLRDLDVVVD